MTSQQKKKHVPSSKQSFTGAILSIASRFSLHTVFDDFLTMAIAAFTQNLQTGKSWYEDEYMDTIAKYKDSELRYEFPNALAYLITEMEEAVNSSLGNDVLGSFFEQHISSGRNGQFFTPFPVCQFMAQITHASNEPAPKTYRPLRIIDPACGSGRMILAGSKVHGLGHEYYGIDLDQICVKMAAINLFLNGIWNSEVLCANALMPGDFVISYRISFLPLGIFKIHSKEESRLWHLYQQSFSESKKQSENIILDPTPFAERKKDEGTQLGLF